VQQHLWEIVGMRSDMHAYICGLDKMVKAKLATVGEKIGEFVPGIKPKRDAGIVIR